MSNFILFFLCPWTFFKLITKLEVVNQMSSMLEYGNWNGMQKGNLCKESRYGFVCCVGWDGMGWDDDDWKVWGVGAERKACVCLKWWHEVKGTVLKVGGYPDTSTPYGAKLVKAKGFSIYFGLSLWAWESESTE